MQRLRQCRKGSRLYYLVPTTILAQQHYNTFVQRMKDFPVTYRDDALPFPDGCAAEKDDRRPEKGTGGYCDRNTPRACQKMWRSRIWGF